MVLIGIPYVQTNPQGQESDSDVFDLFPLFPLFPPLPDPLPAPLPFHLRFRSPMAPGQEFQAGQLSLTLEPVGTKVAFKMYVNIILYCISHLNMNIILTVPKII